MARLFRRKEEGKKSLWDRIVDVALTDVSVIVKGMDEGSLEGLEETLIAADFGVPATLRLVQVVETLAQRGVAKSQRDFERAVREEIVQILSGGRSDTALRFNYDEGPTVFLVVGVNGVGKTTTIAKLAYRLTRQGRKVLLAAGDTFRAGAIEQLKRWADRVGADFVGSEPGRDPAAVAFDALEHAEKTGADVVIVDTAGRLHTQSDLMKELEKVHRVIGKKLDGAPHETLIVLDATVGQNAMAQIRTFGQILPLSGIILTKLDGTAKGGIVVALKEEYDLPVKFIGVGEKMDDLVPFEIKQFAEEVLEA
ncbi:signal recognition particle-docking protein FtsY [Longimicrobium sp.]|uniref:signal recognition particle-docking protein FtsY n=1 Tax=Longimicrobium sp. TaxID=2029185 RepID=UPI002BE2249C|nr:signal recognition particle-docking protein FtsY [Longimicrobium sp.]HSU15279.1 signal recognition particle-docking protein FtsY [Longimicrobium sp.]